MRALLLAAALWAPARASEPDLALERRFVAESLLLLDSYEPVREAAAARRRLGLWIEVGGEPEFGRMASFMRGHPAVLISREALARSAERQRRAEPWEADPARALAWKWLPALVHELAHAALEERIVRGIGRPFPIGLVEDEILAYTEEARCHRGLRRARPELFLEEMLTPTPDLIAGEDLLSCSVYAREERADLIATKVRLQQSKRRPSVLFQSRESLISELSGLLGELRSPRRPVPTGWGRLLSDLGYKGSPERERRRRREDAAVIANAELALEFLSSPRRFAELRDLLDRELREARLRYDRDAALRAAAP